MIGEREPIGSLGARATNLIAVRGTKIEDVKCVDLYDRALVDLSSSRCIYTYICVEK